MMRIEQEKIVRFEVGCGKALAVTHGYNIVNAFPVHFHATYTLGIVEAGECAFRYRGSTVSLAPNDIYMVQPFEPHSCCSVNGLGHSYKVISLALDSRCYFPELVIQSPALLSMIREFHTLAEYDRRSVRLTPLFAAIVEELLGYSLSDTGSCLTDEASHSIQQAKPYIEDCCQQELSLGQMAKAANLSEFHFNRYFHRCYGLSPYAYYLICKVKKSQELLLTHDSVLDTAYGIGFFDQSHFTKLFKKHVGVTPGRYLRDNRPLR